MDIAFIIEDHPDTAEALEVSLTVAGFGTEKFATFDDCWTRMATLEPCLIFMDWHIQGSMDALTFLQHVKTKFPELGICILSGDHRLRDKAVYFGANFILKPFDFEAVHEICALHCS